MILYAGMIDIFLVGLVSLQSLNERTAQDTACFGTGVHSLIDANCSSTEKIYPIRLNTGAKLSTSACPLEMESNATDVLVQQCCLPDTTQDCDALYYTYVPDLASSYLESCVGRQACLTRQASRMDVLSIPTCNSTVYPSQTHYMYLDYYCVPDSKIGRFPSVDMSNDGAGSLLYLQGSTYPWEIASTSVTCSLETDCFTNIDIYGLHVNFKLGNVTCNQGLVMNDTSGTVYTIDCTDNDAVSGYRLRTLATSNNNYMELHYTSLTTNEGLFWLAFKVSGNLTLSCPRKDPINQCLTTTTTPETTTAAETTTTTTEPTSTTTAAETTTTTTAAETTTTTTAAETTTTTTEPTTTTTEPTTTTTEPTSTTTTTTTTTTTHTPVPLPPSKSASTAGSDSSVIIIIVIVIVILLLLQVVAVLVVVLYYKRCKPKLKNERDAEEGDDKKDIQSIQTDRSTGAISKSGVNVLQPASDSSLRTDTRTQNGILAGDTPLDQTAGPYQRLPKLSPTTRPIEAQEPNTKQKRKKEKKLHSAENSENFLHDDGLQPDESNIYKTKEDGQEKRKKKKNKRKEFDNHIAHESSNSLDNDMEYTPGEIVPFNDIANQATGEIATFTDIDNQATGEIATFTDIDNQATETDQPNEKKRRKKKKREKKFHSAKNSENFLHNDGLQPDESNTHKTEEDGQEKRKKKKKKRKEFDNQIAPESSNSLDNDMEYTPGEIAPFNDIDSQATGEIATFNDIDNQATGEIATFTDIGNQATGEIAPFNDIANQATGEIAPFNDIDNQATGEIAPFNDIDSQATGEIAPFNDIDNQATENDHSNEKNRRKKKRKRRKSIDNVARETRDTEGTLRHGDSISDD